MSMHVKDHSSMNIKMMSEYFQLPTSIQLMHNPQADD